MESLRREILSDKPHFMLARDKGERRDYRNGDTIFRPGDTLKGVSVVVSGCVLMTAATGELGVGRSVVFGFLYPGDIFNYTAIYHGAAGAMGVVYTANGPSTTINTLPFSLVDADFTTEIARQSSLALVRSQKQVSDICTLPVEERVLNLLVAMARSPAAITDPDGLVVRLTRIQIGLMVGCSREMVGTTLKELQCSGVLSLRGKDIIVPHELMASPIAEGL